MQSITPDPSIDSQEKPFKEKKNLWNPEEDEILKQLVHTHTTNNWTLISELLPGRTGKQCRERWYNHLSDGIKKGGWSEEEDKIITTMRLSVGNQWCKITKMLPGRTDNAVKNRFHAMERAQIKGKIQIPDYYDHEYFLDLISHYPELEFDLTTHPYPSTNQSFDPSLPSGCTKHMYYPTSNSSSNSITTENKSYHNEEIMDDNNDLTDLDLDSLQSFQYPEVNQPLPQYPLTANNYEQQQQQQQFQSAVPYQQQQQYNNTIPYQQQQQPQDQNTIPYHQQQQVYQNTIPYHQQQPQFQSILPVYQQQQYTNVMPYQQQQYANTIPYQQQQQQQNAIPYPQQQQQIYTHTIPAYQQQPQDQNTIIFQHQQYQQPVYSQQPYQQQPTMVQFQQDDVYIDADDADEAEIMNDLMDLDVIPFDEDDMAFDGLEISGKTDDNNMGTNACCFGFFDWGNSPYTTASGRYPGSGSIANRTSSGKTTFTSNKVVTTTTTTTTQSTVSTNIATFTPGKVTNSQNTLTSYFCSS